MSKTPKTFQGYEVFLSSHACHVSVVVVGDHYFVELPEGWGSGPVAIRRGSTDEDRLKAAKSLGDYLSEYATREILDALGYAQGRPDTEALNAPEAPDPAWVADVMAAEPVRVTLEQFNRLNAHEALLRRAVAAGVGGAATRRYLEQLRDRIDTIMAADGPGVQEWRASLSA